MQKIEKKFSVGRDKDGSRLDKFLAEAMAEISRSRIQHLISDGHVLLDGHEVKAHHKVHSGDEVRITVPPPREAAIEPEDIPLKILYEDDHLLVVDKPAGMIVHPAGDILKGTLVNALLARCKKLSGIGGVLKPGIVHRLDKGTSGCLLVAKDDETHLELSRQFAERKIGKRYLGIVHGNLREDRIILEGAIARHPVNRKRMAVRHDTGRQAETRCEVLERFGDFTYIRLDLMTGRTHQLRVHLSHIGHPILGDDTYGGRRANVVGDIAVLRPMLHAWRLTFKHPASSRIMRMEAPVPEDMERVLGLLRSMGK